MSCILMASIKSSDPVLSGDDKLIKVLYLILQMVLLIQQPIDQHQVILSSIKSSSFISFSLVP